MFKTVAIFCAIITGVISGPAGARGPSKCVSFCKESTKFGYEPGTTYYYDYTTEISTSVINGATQESRIILKAKAEIHAVSQCELSLTLKNVAIEETDEADINSRHEIEGSQILSHELSSHPLLFSFQDGKIEHLCASEDDPVWALNVKRGLISAFQNTMESLNQEQNAFEIDVSGRCHTRYAPTGESWSEAMTESRTFNKTKELTGCSQRYSHISALQSIPYTSSTLMQSIPLLSGEQQCTQTIRNGKIDKVLCHESHKFQPFQKEASGAQTTISQTLVYSSERTEATSIDSNLRIRKTSLLFQNQGPSDATQTDIVNILAILEKLEHENVPEIRADAPRHFSELVENLRLINLNAIKRLFERINSPIAKKYLLDAMPVVASAPSLTLMRDLFLSNKLTDKQVDTWLTSLIFIKNPTLDMISALKPLLSQGSSQQAMLGVTALINSYCKEHTTCTDEDDVKQSLENVFSFLGSDCEASTSEHQRRILFALKAVGNAGRFPSDDSKNRITLNRCFLSKSNPIEVRLAAIDAFRRIPCGHYDNQPILSIYSNMNEDTELRIKSYLTSMKCADRQLIDTVKDILYTDAVNQVSSFVWTHLTNLQETASPEKQVIRVLLADDFLKNKFNTDARKYSRNYEGSLYWEKWNAGATSEADVIFTPDSFFPRSGMVNLTVHLFGTSVNLLEFGGRVKALEQLLEPIFGPNGYFPDDSVTRALHTIRTKRDVSNNEIERLNNIYDQATNEVVTPRGSVYARIFGHEVMYRNFDLVNEKNEPSIVDEEGQDWLDINTILRSVTQGKDIEYSKSAVILDATYTVATSVGIPLSLAVKSAATVGIVANGKMDIDKFWGQKELDIQGLMRSSAAVQVDGILSAKLGRANSAVQSGLRLQNTLHSSTAVEGQVTIKEAKLIHASLSLPQDKQEIFKASSQLLILRPSGQNHKIEQGPAGIPKIQYKGCKGTQILGIEFCGEIDVPEDFDFPMTTPAVVALYLQKTDTFHSYVFDYKFNKDHSETSVSITFDTPGSRVDRRLAANFLLDVENGKLDASVKTPSKSFNVDGKYSAMLKQLQLTVSVLQEQVFLFNAAMYKQGNRLEPSLLLKFYNRPLLEIEGNVDLLNIDEANGKASFDLNVKHLTQSPITFDGDITRNEDKYETRIGVGSYLLTGNARSQIRVKPGHLSAKSSVDYSWKQSESKSASLNFKIQNTKKGALTRFYSQFNFGIADVPDNNIEFSIESQKSNGYCENTVKVSVGKSIWEGHSLYKNQVNKDQQDLSVQLSVAAPRHEIDYNIELTHLLNSTKMSTKFLGRISSENEIKAEIEYLDDSTELLKKSLTAIASWPNTEYSLRSNLKELKYGDYEGELIISPNGTAEMKSSITYKNGSNNVKLDHVLEFRARGFTDAPITGKAALLAGDKQFHSNAQLEIEGKNNYSGRWSTSLDYAVVKINTHKLEGKLTLNEQKYTGEVNFKKNKNGDNILNIDMKAKRRVAIEATLNGDLSGPIYGSLNFYPDKDSKPEDKFGFKGTIDPRGINFEIDYFGQQITTAASYGDSKFQFQLSLWDNQVYSLLVEAPELGLHKIHTVVKLATPIDGFRQILLNVQHDYSSDKLDTKLSGIIDEFKASTSLVVVLGNHQSQLEASLEATGIKTLKLFSKIIRQSSEKSLEITLERGDAKRTLKGELTRTGEGLRSNFYFTGCGKIPEIIVDVFHSSGIGNQLNSYVKAEWAEKESKRQQVSATLSGRAFPLDAKIILKTPYENFEILEGEFSMKESSTERDMKITLNANLDIMPLTLQTHCMQDGSNFKHDIIISWSSQNNERVINLSSEGQYFSVANSNVKTKLNLPDHTYQLNWNSEKDHKTQKLELELEYDQKRYSTGFDWSFNPQSNRILSSAWYEFESQPRTSLEFEYMKYAKNFKIQIISSRGEQVLMKFATDLHAEGWLEWNFKSLLNSNIGLPHIQLTSVHSTQDVRDIRHKTQLVYGEGETRTITAEFNFSEGRHIRGALICGGNDIKLRAELYPTEDKIIMSLTSTLFDEMQVVGQLSPQDRGNQGSLSISSNGRNLISMYAATQAINGEFKVDFETDCSFGHHLIGNFTLNVQNQHLGVYLKEDKANLIDVSLQAQVQFHKGYVNMSMKGDVLNTQDMIHLHAEYDLQDEYSFMLNYKNRQFQKSIKGHAVWNDETKSCELDFDLAALGIFRIELTGISKIVTFFRLNGELLFKVTGTHDLEQGEYVFGKHTLKLVAETGESENPLEITTTIGLDLNKFLFIIQTPILGWENIHISSQFNFSEPKKIITLIAKKGEYSFAVNASMLLNRREGQLSAEIKTPIPGYSDLDIKLEYTNKYTIEGKIHVEIESKKFLAYVSFAPSKIDALLEIPYQTLKKVFVSANWNLSGTSKNFMMKFGRNDDIYQLHGTWALDKKTGDGVVTFISGSDEYKIHINYDLSNDYEGHITLHSNDDDRKIGFKVILNKQIIELEAYTPIQGYENIRGKVLYNKKSHNHHSISAEWDLNGESGLLNFDIILLNEKIQFEAITPISGLETVRAELIYQFDRANKFLSATGQIGQGKAFKLTAQTKLHGVVFQLNDTALASIKLNMELPLADLQTFTLETRYKRDHSVHNLDTSVVVNGNAMTEHLKVTLPQSDNLAFEFVANMSAPVFGIELAESDVQMKIDPSSVSTVLGKASLNGKEHALEAAIKFTQTTADVQIQTTAKALKNFRISGRYDDDSKYQVVLLINDQQFTVKGQYLFNGFRQTKFSVEVSSPLEGLQSMKTSVEIKLHSGSLNAGLSFQNERHRYMTKLQGTYDNTQFIGYLPAEADIKLIVSSPIYDFENIIASGSYSLKQESFVRLSVERNQKEEINGEATWSNSEIKANLATILPDFQLNTKNVISWGMRPFHVAINIDAGSKQYRMNLKTNIQGLKFGEINFSTSIDEWEEFHAKWGIQGNLSAGQALATFNLGKLGEKSFRSSWKNDDWESTKIDFSYKPNRFAKETGLAAQYTIIGGRMNETGKIAATLALIVDGKSQEMTFSTSLKRTLHSTAFDLTVQTPYELVREATLHGKLSSNQEISLEIQAALNHKVLLTSNSIISIGPMASRLKLTFNAPHIVEPFSLTAAYDLKTSQKYVEFSFNQNKYQISIRADANVPQNSNEIELHMNVDSNVPLLQVSASGSIKAAYKMDNDETRYLTVSVNSPQTGKWEVTGALRLLSDFHAQLQISSPRHEILPSMKFKLNYRGSIRQGIINDVSFQLGDHPEAKFTMSVSIDKILATFISGLPGFENMFLEAKLESGAGYANKKFSVDIQAIGKNVTLNGLVNIPSKSSRVVHGSLELKSDWNMIKNGAIHLHVEDDGSVEITGDWGEKKLRIHGYSHVEGNNYWWMGAKTDLVLEINAEELMKIKVNHIISDNVYSLNITLDDNYSVESYLQTGSEKILSASAQWESDKKVKIFAEAGSGRFMTSIDTPWSSPMNANGMYNITDKEQTAKGNFVYDGQRSSIEANARKTDGAFESSVSVDIPALHQKLDAELKIRKLADNVFHGTIDLRMSDRRLTIQGEFTDNEIISPGRKVARKTLKLFLTLPSKSYPQISAETSVEIPTVGFASFLIEGSISLPNGVSKAAVGYEIPTHSAQQVGVRLMVNSPFVSENPIEFIISTEIERARKFNVRFLHKSNNVQLAWDTTLPQLNVDISVQAPELLPSHSPLKFQMDGTINLPTEISIKITGSCSQYSFNVESQAVQSETSIDARLVADIPILLTQKREITFRAQKNVSGRYTIDLSGSKGSSSVELISEVVLQQNTISASGKVMGAYGNHFVKFSGNRAGNNWEVEINGESVTLLRGKRINVVGHIKPTETGMEIDVECRTRGFTHTGKFIVTLDPQNGLLSVNIEPFNMQPFNTTIMWSVESKSFTGTVDTTLQGERHVTEVGLNTQDLEAHFNVKSPLLPGEELNIHAKAITKSNNLDLLGDAKWNGAHWKLEATSRYVNVMDMEAKVEIRTPFEAWERITFAGKIDSDELLAEVFTPFKNFPNAMFKMSGIHIFEKFSLESMHNMQPVVIIGLPWVTYSVSATTMLPRPGSEGEFLLSFECKSPKNDNSKKYEASLQFPSLEDINFHMTRSVKLRFYAKFPNQRFSTIQWELGGRLLWKTWAELNAVAELNGKKIELISEVRNEKGNRRFSVALSTPFQGYEKYIASIKLENYEEIGTGRSILVELQRPEWKESVRLEIDYRYHFNGFMDINGEVNIAAPKFVVDFPPLALRMRSNLKGGVYKGSIDSTWGEKRPYLKIEAAMLEDRTYATIESMFSPLSNYNGKASVKLTRQSNDVSLDIDVEHKGEQVFVIGAMLSHSSEIIDYQINVKTPFAILRTASAVARLSPVVKNELITIQKVLNTLDISLGASYNDNRLFQIELISKSGRRSLEIYNPFRPISLALTYERVVGQKLRVLSEVCWDLNNVSESTIGLEIILSKTSATRNAFIKIQAGEIGRIEAVLSHLLTSSKFDQGLKIIWFSPKTMAAPKELGYICNMNDVSTTNSKKYDVRIRVDSPWRSLQVEAKHHNTAKESYRFVELKWDVSRDATKLIGFTSRSEITSAWRSRTVKDTFTLMHSVLPKAFTIVLNRVYKNQRLQVLGLSVQPTEFKDNHFDVTFSTENTNGVSIQILVSHPATNLKIESLFKKTHGSLALYLNYMDIGGSAQVVHIDLTRDNNSDKLFEIRTGRELNSILKIQLQEEEDKTTFTLRSPNILQLDFHIHKIRPLVDMMIEYESRKQLYLSAGSPNKKEISVKIWRNEYGLSINDLEVALRLNTSQILSTKLNWRPDLLYDVRHVITYTVPKTIKHQSETILSLTKAKILGEMQGRWNMIHPSVKEILENLGAYTQAELTAIHEEVIMMTMFFESMYTKNSFYVKDILGFVGAYLEGVRTTCSYAYNIFEATVKVTVQVAGDAITKISRVVNKYGGNLENMIVPLLDSVEDFVLKQWEKNCEELVKYFDTIKNAYEMIIDFLEGRIEQLEEKLMGIRFVRKAIRLYQDYSLWIEELPLQEYSEVIKEFFKEKVWAPLEIYYKPYLDAINDIIQDKNLQTILELPPMPYVRHVFIKIKGCVNRFLNFIEAEKKMKELLTKAIKALDSMVRRNIPYYTVIWDIEKGEIEYHQPLPLIEWEDFTSLPHLKSSEENDHDINKMSDFYYGVLDKISNLKPIMDMNIRDILPPFGAHAVMSGDYHYYTFDKKYFRFAGECSYVLAADLLHKNFSLLVNYGTENGDVRKKSYTLVSNNQTIDIDTNNLKVSLNGRKSELPLRMQSIFIRRLPNSLEIFDTRGFQMTCSQTPVVCTVAVSGWYFGKIAGLLGTYDNEQVNDMTTPNGQILTDVTSFAHSWRVGKNSDQCRMKNFARTITESSDVDGVCSQHFDDRRSLLRPCFSRVDTTVFRDMCRYDTSRNLNKASREESACNAISAYVAECQKNGVDIWLPPTCIRCKFEDGTTLISGENATLEISGDVKPPKSSDVVILLEESSCLSSYGLTDVVRKLDETLKIQGLNENRYALIGFAGEGPHVRPHIRTSSGQVWAHSTLFKISENIEMNGDGHGDLYEAIEFAASTLKFRAGVSKTIIAITCGDEHCGSERHFADTLTLLLENDIKLHMLTPKEFTTKILKKDSISSKIYGIDSEGVYTSAHLKKPSLQADTSLKRQINWPKDLCTPLAVETNGTRFYLPRASRKPLDIWTRRVALTAQPSECQHCECIPDKSGSPHVVCNQCVSPVLKRSDDDWEQYGLEFESMGIDQL